MPKTNSDVIRFTTRSFLPALVIGTSGALSYCFHFLQPVLSTSAQYALSIVYLAIAIVGATLVVLSRGSLLQPYIDFSNKLGKLSTVGLVVMLGVFASLVIPVDTIRIFDEQDLIIRATGQQGSFSKGNEVWVLGLQGENSSSLAMDDLDWNGWEVRDSIRVFHQAQPAEAHWHGRIGEAVVVRLLKHPWSGIVEIVWNGTAQKIDLFADPGGSQTLILQPKQTLLNDVVSILVRTIDTLLLGALLFGLIAYGGSLARVSHTLPAFRIKTRHVVGLFTLSATTWLIFLLSNWPGVSTVDSGMQWTQVSGAQWTDWHPAIHTLLMWLITRVWYSPAAIAIVQIVALSTVTTWIVTRAIQYGVPVWLALTVVALFAIAPTNGILVNTLWKDVAYSISVLALSGQLMLIVLDDGAWLKKTSHWLAFGLVLTQVALFRHNGPAIAFVVPVVLAIVLRKQAREAAYSLGMCLTLWAGCRNILYPAIGVDNSGSQPGLLWILVHHIAAQTNANPALDPEDRLLLEDIRPDYPWPYDCTSINYTVFDGKFNSARAVVHFWDLARLAGQLALRSPEIALHHQVCTSFFVWRVRWPPAPYEFYFTIPSNEQGVTQRVELTGTDTDVNRVISTLSYLGPISEALHSWLAQSLHTGLAVLFWRPALQLYGLCFGVLVVALRWRNWKWLLVSIPVVINSAVIGLLAPGQDFRFQYSVFLVGSLLTPLVLFIKPYGAALGGPEEEKSRNTPAQSIENRN